MLWVDELAVDQLVSEVVDGTEVVLSEEALEDDVELSVVTGGGVVLRTEVVEADVVEAVTEETIQEHAELTASVFKAQFSRYAGIAVGSVLIVVV